MINVEVLYFLGILCLLILVTFIVIVASLAFTTSGPFSDSTLRGPRGITGPIGGNGQSSVAETGPTGNAATGVAPAGQIGATGISPTGITGPQGADAPVDTPTDTGPTGSSALSIYLSRCNTGGQELNIGATTIEWDTNVSTTPGISYLGSGTVQFDANGVYCVAWNLQLTESPTTMTEISCELVSSVNPTKHNAFAYFLPPGTNRSFMTQIIVTSAPATFVIQINKTGGTANLINDGNVNILQVQLIGGTS